MKKGEKSVKKHAWLGQLFAQRFQVQAENKTQGKAVYRKRVLRKMARVTKPVLKCACGLIAKGKCPHCHQPCCPGCWDQSAFKKMGACVVCVRNGVV